MDPVDRCTLASYLNDHLAGSVAALGMLRRLREAHEATPLGALLANFEETLDEEQVTVRALIAHAGGSPSTMGQAVAWVGERVARLKVGPGHGDESGLELFEALELLSVGFWGRRLLWRALAHHARATDASAAAAHDWMATRAELQLEQLEVERLAASVGALTTTGVSLA
jgi:hypothetical protein